MHDVSSTASPNPTVVIRPALLHVEDAAIALAGRTICQQAHLSVQPGAFLALLGPNGAGKSPLLPAILGLIPLSAGKITVLGHPARRGNATIGYVPQRRHFESDVHRRGRSIVRLGLDGAHWGLPFPFIHPRKACDTATRIQEAIDLVGARGYADRPIGELSGGEQQRLLIAQAFVTRPHILALHEPLDSLELRNQQAVAGVIRHISQETGATVLLVAHDINPILPAVDRVVSVARGHIAVGTPEEGITTETLSRLYTPPIEVLRTRDGRIVVVGQPQEEVREPAHLAR
jgi:zinc/manganese transport system ATP-binding protein